MKRSEKTPSQPAGRSPAKPKSTKASAAKITQSASKGTARGGTKSTAKSPARTAAKSAKKETAKKPPIPKRGARRPSKVSDEVKENTSMIESESPQISPETNPIASSLKEAESLLGNLDETLSDMKSLVDLIGHMEKTANLCRDAQAAPMALTCVACGQLLDALLLDQVKEPRLALTCAADALRALRDCLDSPEDTEVMVEILTSPHSAMGNLIGVEFGQLSDAIASADASTAQNQVEATRDPAAEPAPETDSTPDPPQQVSPAPPAVSGEAPAPSGAIEIPPDDVELFGEFIFESNSHLESVETELLELERNPADNDLINAIFRCVHSLKGSAGFLGLTDINRLAHETETILDMARKEKLAISRPIIDCLLDSFDLLKGLIGNVGLQVERCQGKPIDESLMRSIDIRPMVARLQTIKPGQQPAAKPAPPPRIGELLVEDGTITPEQLEQAIVEQQRPLGQILTEKGYAPPEKVESALARQRAAGGGQGATAIKVDIHKLDNLVEMVGEAVITQSFISQSQANGLVDQSTGIAKSIQQMDKIMKDLQGQAMTMRMLPVKQTFQKMVRLVRDASHKAGKRVDLKLSGEETELDKTVIEQISDPLVHLLRNSVDHGIEPPEERLRVGKPEVGQITLSAFHQGENICLEILDDGKGLSRERIRAKGIKQGLISENDQLSEAQIFRLIFEPGFSTAEKITEISGRGVGMDVVKRHIERLRGRVEISSVEGKETRVLIRLPLTLAIIDGMITRVGKERYIIPLVSITESFRPGRQHLSTVGQQGELINLRGRLIPLVRLHRLFGVKADRTDPTNALVMIVESQGQCAAVLVDDLVGQQQVVIKNLGQVFGHLDGVSGACILGDGRVGLILDVEGLIHGAQQSSGPVSSLEDAPMSSQESVGASDPARSA